MGIRRIMLLCMYHFCHAYIYTRCFVLCMLMTRLSLHHSCASTGKAIPKDKAIKRFVVRYVLSAPCLRMQSVSMIHTSCGYPLNL